MHFKRVYILLLLICLGIQVKGQEVSARLQFQSFASLGVMNLATLAGIYPHKRIGFETGPVFHLTDVEERYMYKMKAGEFVGWGWNVNVIPIISDKKAKMVTSACVNYLRLKTGSPFSPTASGAYNKLAIVVHNGLEYDLSEIIRVFASAGFGWQKTLAVPGATGDVVGVFSAGLRFRMPLHLRSQNLK